MTGERFRLNRRDAMDDLFQLAQLALVVVFGAGILVAGRLFMRR